MDSQQRRRLQFALVPGVPCEQRLHDGLRGTAGCGHHLRYPPQTQCRRMDCSTSAHRCVRCPCDGLLCKQTTPVCAVSSRKMLGCVCRQASSIPAIAMAACGLGGEALLCRGGTRPLPWLCLPHPQFVLLAASMASVHRVHRWRAPPHGWASTHGATATGAPIVAVTTPGDCLDLGSVQNFRPFALGGITCLHATQLCRLRPGQGQIPQRAHLRQAQRRCQAGTRCGVGCQCTRRACGAIG